MSLRAELCAHGGLGTWLARAARCGVCAVWVWGELCPWECSSLVGKGEGMWRKASLLSPLSGEWAEGDLLWHRWKAAKLGWAWDIGTCHAPKGPTARQGDLSILPGSIVSEHLWCQLKCQGDLPG